MRVTEEIRREVISATGLCLNPKCKAHDAVVEKIWKYKENAAAAAEDLVDFGTVPRVWALKED